jgi:hypothetical protein
LIWCTDISSALTLAATWVAGLFWSLPLQAAKPVTRTSVSADRRILFPMVCIGSVNRFKQVNQQGLATDASALTYLWGRSVGQPHYSAMTKSVAFVRSKPHLLRDA